MPVKGWESDFSVAVSPRDVPARRLWQDPVAAYSVEVHRERSRHGLNRRDPSEGEEDASGTFRETPKCS
jgi:hypothetical protein